MEIINHTQAEDMIRKSGGKLFGVTFIKRSNNAPRRMTGRLGVRKGVNGNGQPFNPRDHNLVVIHEFVGNPETTRAANGQFAGGGNLTTQFRSLPLERITELRIGGKKFQVQ